LIIKAVSLLIKKLREKSRYITYFSLLTLWI